MTPTEETYHFRGDVGLSWDRYVSNIRSLIREYMKRLAKGIQPNNVIIIRVMVTQNTASNVNIIGSSNEASSILREWYDFVAEVEQELGMSSFKREDHNIENVTRGDNTSTSSYLLQQGITLKFWRAFTFANSRVNEEYKLVPNEKTQFCPHPYTDFGILWNGDVTLCCLDYDATLNVGSVKDQSIEDIMKSSNSKKLRASMYGLEKLHPTCVKCQSQAVHK